MTPREWLHLVAEYAPALRTAGVRAVTLGDHSFTLDPALPVEAPVQTANPIAPAPTEFSDFDDDPLDDPSLYGGVVPGYDLSKIDREADR